MKKQILDYTVIIRPDERTGTNQKCYSAYCPALGLSDDGDTIEAALKNIKSLIKFHLECLIKENAEVPLPDTSEFTVSLAKIPITGNPRFAIA